METAEEGDTLLLHFKSIRQSGEIFENNYDSEGFSAVIGKKQINHEFEKALIGKHEGDTVTVVLPPEKAYGKFNKRLIIPIKRSRLNPDKEPSIGEMIPLEFRGRKFMVRVVGVTESKITIDANHPLAGETMTYEISIVKILKKSASL